MSSRTYSNVRDVSMKLPSGGAGMAESRRMCWGCQRPRLVRIGARVLRGMWYCAECMEKKEEKK